MTTSLINPNINFILLCKTYLTNKNENPLARSAVVIIFNLSLLQNLMVIASNKELTSQDYFNKAIEMESLGHSAQAIRHYDIAIKLQPNFADAYNNKGNILTKLGKYKEAIDSYNLAIKYQPERYEPYLNKGAALADLGEYQGAINSFDLAIKYQPERYEAYNNKGVALRSLGKYQEAEEVFNKAKALRTPKF